MGRFVLYNVNIAMEVAMVFVMAILLGILLLEKKLFTTTIPLICLTSSIIGLLIDHIVIWVMLLENVTVVYGATPMRIVYILDVFFSYGIGAAFYCYVEALAIDGYRQIGIKYKANKHVKSAIAVWGVVNIIVYSIMVFIPSVYRVENGVAVYSFPAFIWVHISIKFACVCALILIVKHKKVIGKNEALINFGFLSVITVMLVVEELLEICVGSVLLALFTLVLYVRVDFHNALRIERQERDLAELKTEIMLSQMQPHFMYNVLTTISSLCEMQNAIQARDVVNRFADYFRTNLDSLGKEKTIPFEKELEHIKTYLWLEKVRFEDTLNIVYEIGPSDFEVPSLAIQPIVENAVKHGILPKEEPGTLIIKTYDTSLDYVIVVEDDGVGFDVNEKPNDSRARVGIENVSKRLEIICNGSCNIQSKIGAGTVVSIHIPKGVSR